MEAIGVELTALGKCRHRKIGVHRNEDGTFWAECVDCKIRGKAMPTPLEARQAVNRRKGKQPGRKLPEALMRAKKQA